MRRFLELPPILCAEYCAMQAHDWPAFWFFMVGSFAIALWEPNR
ncbi:MAG: hypothetical protein ACOC7J_06420 [Armatimonadota bacterium]